MKKRDLEFLYEVGSLRHMPRLWKRFLTPDFKNNTEHTFRVAWIALMIANIEGTGNHEKILKLALLHDLPESRSTDVDYLSRQYVERNEDLAARDVFETTSLEEEFLELWHEYSERKSIEAKIVKDADNLDVDMELQEQETRGFKLKKFWSKQRDTAVYKKLYTKTAKRLAKLINKSNPHDWHLNGRNRFNAGDWKKP